jgi:hypothetical protein
MEALQFKYNKRRNKIKITSTEAEDSTHNSRHVRKVKVKKKVKCKKKGVHKSKSKKVESSRRTASVGDRT